MCVCVRQKNDDDDDDEDDDDEDDDEEDDERHWSRFPSYYMSCGTFLN